MDNSVIVFGAGSHCAAMLDVLSMLKLDVYGLITPDVHEAKALNLKYLGTDSDAVLSEAKKHATTAVMALMRFSSLFARQSLFSHVESMGFEVPVIVSPLAHIAYNATLGKGTTVMHHALVNAAASVGDNCIVGTNTLIDTGSKIDSHCSISSGVIVGRGVTVGSGTFVGDGAIIYDECIIGENCYIEPGCHVKGRIAPDSTCKASRLAAF